MNQEELTKLLNYLIDAFKINKWHINLYFVDTNEIQDINGNSNAYAITSYKPHIGVANIYMNTDIAYEPWDLPEYTLIHEVVHIINYDLNHFSKYELNAIDNSFYSLLLERFCNEMAYGIWECINSHRHVYKL